MDLRKRLVQLGKKITPSNKMTYVGPKDTTPPGRWNNMTPKSKYVIPKTPKDSGLGWGP